MVKCLLTIGKALKDDCTPTDNAALVHFNMHFRWTEDWNCILKNELQRLQEASSSLITYGLNFAFLHYELWMSVLSSYSDPCCPLGIFIMKYCQQYCYTCITSCGFLY